MSEAATIEFDVNGIDTRRLRETVDAIKDDPELAKFQFRVRNQWFTGGHNRSQIREFYGVGREDLSRRQPFVLNCDAPDVLLGADEGPSPEEYFLHSLSACLTTSLVYQAAALGIRIEHVESTIEGDLDLRGFLRLDDKTRPGFQRIHAKLRVKADAPIEQLRELASFSPVFDSVINSVSASFDLDPMD